MSEVKVVAVVGRSDFLRAVQAVRDYVTLIEADYYCGEWDYCSFTRERADLLRLIARLEKTSFAVKVGGVQ